MIKINVTGDFYSTDVKGITFSKELDALLFDADINITNMEAPVKINTAKAIKKSGPSLCQDLDVPKFLEDKGFNIVSFANNHIMDYGAEALIASKKSFSKAVIIGSGTYEEAYQVKYVNVKGKRIGFMAFTQYEFGVLSEKAYDKDNIGSAWMCHPYIDSIIFEARKQCDFLLLIPHAGLEYFELPLPELRTLYHHFIDIGADAVIASHPHIIQPYEIYKGKPIAYSLGNFYFDEDDNRETWFHGLVTHLEISNHTIKMNVYTTHFDRIGKNIELTDKKEEGKRLNDLNALFHNEEKYIKRVNAHCLSIEATYDMLFEMSGLYRMTIKRCIGLIKRIVLHQEPKYDEAHFINNLRCESHRWALSRIYELKK